MKNRTSCLVLIGAIFSGMGVVADAQPCLPAQATMLVSDDGVAGDAYGWAARCMSSNGTACRYALQVLQVMEL